MSSEKQLEGEAYAVYDPSDNSLSFVRGPEGQCPENDTHGTIVTNDGASLSGYVFSGFEDTDDVPWAGARGNVKTVRFCDTIRPQSTARWFDGMDWLSRCDGMENLDTSATTDMSDMFTFDFSLKDLDVSNFDTSCVTNMSAMFQDCKNLASLDVSRFDTSEVVDMNAMFHSCKSLDAIDVSRFDMSHVVDCAAMFAGCESVRELDLSNSDFGYCFDEPEADCGGMFYDCKSLESIDYEALGIHGFTTAVRDELFEGCTSLEGPDGRPLYGPPSRALADAPQQDVNDDGTSLSQPE